jgi:hypothetical protein
LIGSHSTDTDSISNLHVLHLWSLAIYGTGAFEAIASTWKSAQCDKTISEIDAASFNLNLNLTRSELQLGSVVVLDEL